MYEGPPRGKDDVALLTTQADRGFWSGPVYVTIAVVDGASLSTMTNINHNQQIEVLPGSHVIEVSYFGSTPGWAPMTGPRLGSSKSNVPLHFDVEAGHRYEVCAGTLNINGFFEGWKKSFHWVAWIADLDTGKIIAGPEPGEGDRS